MKSVWLCQINNTFGSQVFIPYSVGLLQAFAQTKEEIRDAYKFQGFIYLREKIEDVVKKTKGVDVLGVSNYIWNSVYSRALAKAVKEANPNCLVVMGGPHVPNRSEKFFQEHPYVDLLVHNEGEHAFSEILLERLRKGDYRGIVGLSVNIRGQTLKTKEGNRVTDIDSLPSPYLSGVFDELMSESYDFLSSQETHRGCPYQCTYCDWGSSTYTKVRRFGDERIVNELEWFSKYKTDLLYNCDANWGMFPRDIELTKRMVEIKRKTGYPNKFRAAYAKNSGDAVYTISKLLHEAGMNKGVTLSFQSMDDDVLHNVKRKNIGTKVFSNLMKRYRKEGIATYSEIIVGLPGETYDSFAEGIDELIREGQHQGLNCYICEALPNSELSDPEYVKKYGLKFATVPVLHFHGSAKENEEHIEQYDLVVETNTLSKYDWLRCLRFSWCVQALHCLGLTQIIAVFCHQRYGTGYRQFYESLLDYADEHPETVLGEVSSLVTDLFSGIPSGKGWGIVDERFGDVIWPPEEGGFLKIVAELPRFYGEIATYLYEEVMPKDSQWLLDDLMDYQEFSLVTPYQDNRRIEWLSNWDLLPYLEAGYMGEKEELKAGQVRYRITPQRTYADLVEYAREAIWFGRKGGTNLHKVERVERVS